MINNSIKKKKKDQFAWIDDAYLRHFRYDTNIRKITIKSICHIAYYISSVISQVFSRQKQSQRSRSIL